MPLAPTVMSCLAIQYKESDSLEAEEGTVHDVTKKEFCRLIKGAELVEE